MRTSGGNGLAGLVLQALLCAQVLFGVAAVTAVALRAEERRASERQETNVAAVHQAGAFVR